MERFERFLFVVQMVPLAKGFFCGLSTVQFEQKGSSSGLGS